MTRAALTALAPLIVLGCTSPDVRNFGVVEENVLLRAGQSTPLGLAYLRDAHGVRTVINLTREGQNEELVAAMALGLDYLPLPTSTYGIERENLVTVLAAIRQAERDGRAPVLVHCRSGQDRTGTAVALFRIVEGGTLESAEAEMERYQHWLHSALFPHLRGIPREADAFRAVWAEAVERTGEVPILRPPAPWPYAGAPASGVLPAAVEVTQEPGVF